MKWVMAIAILLIAFDVFADDCGQYNIIWKEAPEVVGFEYPVEREFLREHVNKYRAKYQEYFRNLFILEGELCSSNNGVILMINNYNSYAKGNISIEQYLEIIVSNPYQISAVWNWGRLIFSDIELGEEYRNSDYYHDPSFHIMDDLTKFIDNPTPHMLILWTRLFETSDGIYGEWMHEKTLELFRDNPQVVLDNYEYFSPVEGRLEILLQHLWYDEDRVELCSIYSQYPGDAIAEKIRGWLECAQQ